MKFTCEGTAAEIEKEIRCYMLDMDFDKGTVFRIVLEVLDDWGKETI